MKYTKIILIILISIIIFCTLCVFGIYISQQRYFENIFIEEKLTESFDNKYAYLQLSSKEKLVCTINIYEIDRSYGRQVMYRDILTDFFRDREMRNISWGENTYDLFFDSKEKGVYCYKYDNDEWIGMLYLDVAKTSGEFAKGNEDIYYFSGERKSISKKTVDNPVGFERISAQIRKENIPTYFLDKFAVSTN